MTPVDNPLLDAITPPPADPVDLSRLSGLAAQPEGDSTAPEGDNADWEPDSAANYNKNWITVRTGPFVQSFQIFVMNTTIALVLYDQSDRVISNMQMDQPSALTLIKRLNFIYNEVHGAVASTDG
jgi:hypothetical protein